MSSDRHSYEKLLTQDNDEESHMEQRSLRKKSNWIIRQANYMLFHILLVLVYTAITFIVARAATKSVAFNSTGESLAAYSKYLHAHRMLNQDC